MFHELCRWFMPLNVLITFIIGAALGWLLVKLMRVPHHLQGLVLGCCAAGRVNMCFVYVIKGHLKINPFPHLITITSVMISEWTKIPLFLSDQFEKTKISLLPSSLHLETKIWKNHLGKLQQQQQHPSISRFSAKN